jgi:hypothetical protein
MNDSSRVQLSPPEQGTDRSSRCSGTPTKLLAGFSDAVRPPFTDSPTAPFPRAEPQASPASRTAKTQT